VSLVSYSIPSLAGGVSQQPDTIKHKTQLSSMGNAWPSLVEGLQKRPPTEHYGEMDVGSNWDGDTPEFHFIDRSEDERYVVAVNPDDTQGRRLRVWDLADGALEEKSVKLSRSAYEYLSSAAGNYKFQTIADVTYIVNTSKTVEMDATTSQEPSPMALMFVRGSLASTVDEAVVVTFNGVSTTPTSETSASTQALTAAIYAKIMGDDVQEEDAVGFDTYGKITGSFTGLQNGEAVYFKLDGTGTQTWPTFGPLMTVGLALGPIVTATPASRFYVHNVTPTSCQLGLLPHDPTYTGPGNNLIPGLIRFHNSSALAAGADVELWSVGTNSVLTGFENIQLTGMEGGSGENSGNILLVSTLDGEDFDLTVTDSAGNSLVSVYKDTSDTFAELPSHAKDGFRLKVSNEPGTGVDDYYVQFVADDTAGQISSGHWKEVAKAGIEFQIEPSTMPHLLIRGADGSFECIEAGEMSNEVIGVHETDDEVTIAVAGDTSPAASSVFLLADGDPVWFSSVTNDFSVSTFTTYYAKHVSNTAGQQVINLYSDEGLDPSDKITDITRTAGFDSYGTLKRVSPYPNFTWGQREVGDTLTNEDPSFIGNTINGVSFFKNRLVFLSGENVLLSEMGEFFNFFLNTVTQLLASATIDLASSHATVSVLEVAFPFGDVLYCSGRSLQLVLGAGGNEPFSAQSAEFMVGSQLTVDNSISPAAMGSRLYLPFTRGDYIGMFEYGASREVQNLLVEEEITAHVPYYIRGPIQDMAALEREGVLAVLGTAASGDNSTVHLFKTYSRNGQRIQAAWCEFSFHGADVRSLHFYDNNLYIISKRSSGWFVDMIGFKSGRVDVGSSYVTTLDRRIAVTPAGGTYSASTGTTTFTCYPMAGTEPMEVITTDGHMLTVTSKDSGSIEVLGNQEGVACWVGEAYTMEITIPDQYIHEGAAGNYGWQDTGARNAINKGRLQIRRGSFSFNKTSFFKVSVTPLNRTAYTYKYNAQILGGGTLTVGEVPLESGTFSFPVNSKNDEVVLTVSNDSPLPSNLLSAEFEVLFHIRAGRTQA